MLGGYKLTWEWEGKLCWSMRARPWPHPGPGAQYPNFVDEEIETQRVKLAHSHTGINGNTSMASQVKVREAAWQVTAGMGKMSQAFPGSW